MTRRLDYDDAYTTQFEAVPLQRDAYRGRPALELEATYFYPESGGQEADRGRIGSAQVVDVQVDDDGRVWHVLDPEAAIEPGAPVAAEIDWTRRFDHMQQHTGQHVLSAAFEHVLGAPTVSSHLGEERSTIEVPLPDVDWRVVERLEAAANEVVWRDLPVERHWVDEEGARRFALRKAPTVTGRIRIVEIPGWDVSACGGTHTRRTGEVGVIKIVRWERVRGHLRFEFLCGGRALRDYGWRTESLLESARRRTLKDRDLIPHLEKAAAERDALHRELRAVEERLIAAEAVARAGSPPRPVLEVRTPWTRASVRRFALACLEAGAPWAIAAGGGAEPAIVAVRAKSLDLDLRLALPELLERTGGKGGGSPDVITVAPDGERVGDGARWLETWMRGAAPQP